MADTLGYIIGYDALEKENRKLKAEIKRLQNKADCDCPGRRRLESEIERLRSALAKNLCSECERIDEDDSWPVQAAEAAGGEHG